MYKPDTNALCFSMNCQPPNRVIFIDDYQDDNEWKVKQFARRCWRAAIACPTLVTTSCNLTWI